MKWDRPLPDHTKINYDECFAKLVLEALFPDVYVDLQIADKPDLQDHVNDIGIEVTSAIPQKIREALKLWYTMPYIESNQKRNRNKERMRQLGVEYAGGVQAWPGEDYSSVDVIKSPFNAVIKAFDKKVRKLNSSSYTNMKRYDLYVESQLWAWPDIMPNVLEHILKYNNGKKRFTFVYLYCVDAICIFDLMNQIYKIIETKDKLRNVGIEARRIVESGEVNE